MYVQFPIKIQPNEHMELFALVEKSIDISIGFLHRKLAYEAE
jgi:hypothetical protein